MKTDETKNRTIQAGGQFSPADYQRLMDDKEILERAGLRLSSWGPGIQLVSSEGVLISLATDSEWQWLRKLLEELEDLRGEVATLRLDLEMMGAQ